MKKRPPRAEADDVINRIKDARIYLPDSMPLGAVCDLGGVMFEAARLALKKLQPFERATTRVKAITVVEGEKTADGQVYGFRVDYEHDCPNGACDDCID
jgi:hypothetical protein